MTIIRVMKRALFALAGEVRLAISVKKMTHPSR